MLEFHLEESHGIVTMKPHGALESEDFGALGVVVDEYINKTGILHGFIIDAASFPGWHGLDAFKAHMHFIEEHHKKIARVAVVSDSAILSALPSIADFFLQSEVRYFEDITEARKWINNINLD